MDFRNRIGPIRQSADHVRQLLEHERVVVCFGSRATLCFFLAGHLNEQQVVGAFTTAAETLQCLDRQQPGYLLCGSQLEAGCGLELVIEAKRRWSKLRTLLIMSGKPRQDLLKAAIDVGCDGLLLDTSVGHGTATSALETVCRGGIVVDRELAPLLRDHPNSAAGHTNLQSLSPREHEVLALLSQGLHNGAIAEQLVISIDTVKTHVKNLLLKLGANGRTHAAVMALELGLVPWPAQANSR